MINEKNLVRHELIGLKVRIKKSLNSSLRNMKGRIVDETYNTFKIEKENGKEKIVIKKLCTFVFYLPNGKRVEVEGRILVGRPEDRIKKRFERW